MKTVVTGGRGFIGSHVVDALVGEGHDVVVVDNGLSGSNFRNAKASYFDDDVRSAAMDKACDGAGCVFHLAAYASVPGSIENPMLCHESGLEATFYMLEASRKAKVGKIVFSSSSAVYGDTPVEFMLERTPARPTTPYGASKSAGEQYVMAYVRSFGMDAACLRYYNVYGPRQSNTSSYSGVIASFCRAISEQRQPVIYGDGLQERDFVYVGDVVRANLMSMSTDSLRGAAMNISTGQSVSILRIWETLKKVTGYPFSPRFEPTRLGDIKLSCASPMIAKERLGWESSVPLEDGLRETAKFYGIETV